MAIGCGLLSILNAHSSKAAWTGFQIITAWGNGIVMTVVLPAILAALPESDVATATGAYSFVRSFGFTRGVTVPSIVFNGQFNRYIDDISDPAVRAKLSDGTAYSYASGGYVSQLTEPTRGEVVAVYVDSLQTI